MGLGARIPSAMKLQFHTLDVFTASRFGGNPLAVVMGADGLATVEMQAIAREFNLSETIFVQTPESAANTARVRIFFPTGEMPFAGHPTLGCAILLAEMNQKQGCSFETEIRLEEAAGLVPVKVTRIGDVPVGIFKAPVVPFAAEGILPGREDMAAALGLEPHDIGFDDDVGQQPVEQIIRAARRRRARRTVHRGPAAPRRLAVHRLRSP